MELQLVRGTKDITDLHPAKRFQLSLKHMRSKDIGLQQNGGHFVQLSTIKALQKLVLFGFLSLGTWKSVEKIEKVRNRNTFSFQKCLKKKTKPTNKQ